MYRCHLEGCGVPPLKGGKAAKLGELIARFGRLFLSCPDDIFGASKRLSQVIQYIYSNCSEIACVLPKGSERVQMGSRIPSGKKKFLGN